ncbi:DUF292-domain-containing protein [Cylindrobasidium torrendii FP15055 ss-10]|uniref:DUF292-domain-containing protein n=1 Tax=Cylindrobasidium torrendii FP15055 ss-10 TaxID=1314674 RepID=A0A0D7BT59_9AGAR|nr:DUF292-domain-containing protein [Cylindrobasidium torrendii FP15055 ss-10]
MAPWNATKAKVQLRISVQRLRILQQKKEAQAKAARRDIATLVERGKIETARIKVETIIHEDVHIELLELLELYCELLIARFGILDTNSREPDPSVSEGVYAIIYAAPRTELKELHILRDILMHKFGRELSTIIMENSDDRVSERVVNKLDLTTPPKELVDGYLKEITRSYGVPWAPEGTELAEDDAKDGNEAKDEKGSSTPDLGLPAIPPTEDDSDSGNKEKSQTAKPAPSKKPTDDFDDLAKRFEALKKR